MAQDERLLPKVLLLLDCQTQWFIVMNVVEIIIDLQDIPILLVDSVEVVVFKDNYY